MYTAQISNECEVSSYGTIKNHKNSPHHQTHYEQALQTQTTNLVLLFDFDLNNLLLKLEFITEPSWLQTVRCSDC